MFKRPKAGDTEEDLLEFQRQFLAEKTQPSASVVSKAGDKRKTDIPENSSAEGTSKRDIVQLEGKYSYFSTKTYVVVLIRSTSLRHY